MNENRKPNQERPVTSARMVHFPSNYSLGNLYVRNKGNLSGGWTFLNKAKGQIAVSNNQDLYLETLGVFPVGASLLQDELYKIKITGLRINEMTRSIQKVKAETSNAIKNNDSALGYLGGLINLKELDLSGMVMSDTGLAHLKGLTELIELNLSNTHIGDAGMANLKELTALQTLNLSNTHIGDAGMVNLKELNALQTLNLSNTRIGDAGMANLKKLTALRTINISNTKVSSYDNDFCRPIYGYRGDYGVHRDGIYFLHRRRHPYTTIQKHTFSKPLTSLEQEKTVNALVDYRFLN